MLLLLLLFRVFVACVPFIWRAPYLPSVCPHDCRAQPGPHRVVASLWLALSFLDSCYTHRDPDFVTPQVGVASLACSFGLLLQNTLQ